MPIGSYTYENRPQRADRSVGFPGLVAEPLMAGKVRKDINADYDRLVALLDDD